MLAGEVEFSNAYYETRHKEGWIDEDGVVKCLPRVPRNHPHVAHWRVRAITADRLSRIIGQDNRDLRILEVGCGNGWLSVYLARACFAQVLGIDVAAFEIEQARRVWKDESRVTFSVGSILTHGDSLATPLGLFDAVLFSASMQYMPNACLAIKSALKLLRPGCFVLVADTPWYNSKNLAGARARTMDYYKSLGVDSMARWYHHHDIEQLTGLEWSIIPLTLRDRLRILFSYGSRQRFDIIKIINAES